ncbi:MAG: UDP-N-acetylglucosamine 1-carboxyvinyltransferase [Coriobacteriia bacterium]|nr:UDP-N-acetylglucosamine 1-carboxyvinyltransferase [Coriobacteriia bacterium]
MRRQPTRRAAGSGQQDGRDDLADYITIEHSPALSGRVVVAGAKNSVLKLMAASLLIEGVTVLQNVPHIADVEIMGQVLQALGVKVSWTAHHELTLDGRQLSSHTAPYELVAQMRASTAVLGPLSGRCGQARVALPGGCNIGSRKIDMHIAGLQALGAEVRIEHGFINVEVPPSGLQAAEVLLEFPSVGATENLIMAAARAHGTTIIKNAAREPEITDLVAFLQEAGVPIEGAGTSELAITGTTDIRELRHQVIGDRIEAGTFLVAAAMTHGDIEVEGVNPEHLDVVLRKLEAMGARIERGAHTIWLHDAGDLKAVDIQTLPYPGFPTDMQAQFMAADAIAQGSSIVTENVFENRFMFADELGRMGADISIEGHYALVKGNTLLSGAPVSSPDLRGGAALVLAGLVAEGTTTVYDVYHIDRGYEDFCGKLATLGARIKRHSVPG